MEEYKMMKPTWTIHAVHDKKSDRNSITYHTHGIDKYIGIELELAIDITIEDASMILNEIGYAIMDGLKINDGAVLYQILNVPVKVKKMEGVHGIGDKLRIVIPDENGLFPEDEGCSPVYNTQLDDFKNRQ